MLSNRDLCLSSSEVQPRKYDYSQEIQIITNTTGHGQVNENSDEELKAEASYRDLQSEEDLGESVRMNED